MVVGRAESTQAAGKQWTTTQKIGAGLGAAALVAGAAYGVYNHYQTGKDVNAFVEAQQDRVRDRGYDLQMETVSNKRSSGASAPQSSREFFSNPSNEWEIHGGPIKRR